MQGLQNCLPQVPTWQEDVLISWGLKVMINLGNMLKKKKKCICFVVVPLLSCPCCGAKQSHFFGGGAQDAWKSWSPVFWEAATTALYQPNQHYKSSCVAQTWGQIHSLVFLMPFSRLKLVSGGADLNDKVLNLRFLYSPKTFSVLGQVNT